MSPKIWQNYFLFFLSLSLPPDSLAPSFFHFSFEVFFAFNIHSTIISFFFFLVFLEVFTIGWVPPPPPFCIRILICRANVVLWSFINEAILETMRIIDGDWMQVGHASAFVARLQSMRFLSIINYSFYILVNTTQWIFYKCDSASKK